jgi:RNA polymerase sigma factor (sigma-70 family)
MPTGHMNGLVNRLRRAALLQGGSGPSDAQLLAHFVEQRDGDAFTALVRRHGRMVLGVCRRVLLNPHDAEDAFQATFLVLARKAASVAAPNALGGWLYRVAYRTALEARARIARRRATEKQVMDMPQPKVEPEAGWRERHAGNPGAAVPAPAPHRAAARADLGTGCGPGRTTAGGGPGRAVRTAAHGPGRPGGAAHATAAARWRRDRAALFGWHASELARRANERCRLTPAGASS